MSLALWSVEWRLAAVDKRRFALNVFVPLAMVSSVATGAVSPASAAPAYLLIFVVFAVLGTALPLRWEGQRGLAARIVRGGILPARYLLNRTGASASIDVAQLTPSLLVVVVVAGGSAGELMVAYAALILTAWVGGLIGVLVASVGSSLAETGLLGALAVLLLAHMSGVFGSPEAGSVAGLLETVSPFRALHETLVELTVGASGSGFDAAIAWAALLPVLVALLAPRLLASLGRRQRGGLEGV